MRSTFAYLANSVIMGTGREGQGRGHRPSSLEILKQYAIFLNGFLINLMVYGKIVLDGKQNKIIFQKIACGAIAKFHQKSRPRSHNI